MSYYDNVRSCTQKLIDTDTSLINQANDLIENINAQQGALRAAKTYAVGVGALGTLTSIAGICLIPFTAGLSSTLVWSGVTLSAGSAGSHVTTSILDHVESKKTLERIKELTVEHDAAAADFQNMIKDIQDIVQILKQQHNLDENTAITATLAHVVNGAGKISSILKAETAGNIALGVHALKSTKSVLTRNMGGGTSISFTFGKPLAEMTKIEANGIMQVIKNPAAVAKASGSIGKNFVQVAGAVVGVAITLWDVYTLVNEWDKDHPTKANVTNLRDNLIIEKKSLESLLKS